MRHPVRRMLALPALLVWLLALWLLLDQVTQALSRVPVLDVTTLVVQGRR